VPPKCRLTFNGLHGVMTELFVTTALPFEAKQSSRPTRNLIKVRQVSHGSVRVWRGGGCTASGKLQVMAALAATCVMHEAIHRAGTKGVGGDLHCRGKLGYRKCVQTICFPRVQEYQHYTDFLFCFLPQSLRIRGYRHAQAALPRENRTRGLQSRSGRGIEPRFSVVQLTAWSPQASEAMRAPGGRGEPVRRSL
jgi:hypothetical protein